MQDKPTQETMTFGQALEALKAGKTVSRIGCEGFAKRITKDDVDAEDWRIVEEPCAKPADTQNRHGLFGPELLSVFSEINAKSCMKKKPVVDPDDHTAAERLGGLIGTLMAPLALAKLAPGQSGTPPTINVNVWSIH